MNTRTNASNENDKTPERKLRTDDKLTEPLQIKSGVDSKGNPAYFIVGWVTESIRCKRQCSNDGTSASHAKARRIRDEEEFRRAQLLSGTAGAVAMRLTRLNDEQLRDCEAAVQALHSSKRDGVTKHVNFAIKAMVDVEQSESLREALRCYLEERKRTWQNGHIRHGRYDASCKIAAELEALFPGITVHELAFGEIMEAVPRSPKLPLKYYSELLGVSLPTLTRWRQWYPANPMPLPTLVYAPEGWAWNQKEVEALRAWLVAHRDEGNVAKVPDVMPVPPVAAPPAPSSYARPRLEFICERPMRRGKNGARAGSAGSRKSFQQRRDLIMHFLRFALKRKWLASLPVFESYLKHCNRERGRAACLSPEHSEAYMRWYEDNHPELVCIESMKLFSGLRPHGESARVEAWVNPQTGIAVPKLLLLPSAPNPNAIGVWPGIREVRVGDGKFFAGGVILMDPAISKVRMMRPIHMAPNLALWHAVYQGAWRMGSWSPEANSSDLIRFDALADRFYKAPYIDWMERAELRQLVPLSHDILRHSYISYFTALTGSFTAASLESGNSVQIIKAHYYSVRTHPEAEAFFRILPRGWSWGKDGKSFVPPAGWVRPAGWVLSIEERSAEAA